MNKHQGRGLQIAHVEGSGILQRVGLFLFSSVFALLLISITIELPLLVLNEGDIGQPPW